MLQGLKSMDCVYLSGQVQIIMTEGKTHLECTQSLEPLERNLGRNSSISNIFQRLDSTKSMKRPMLLEAIVGQQSLKQLTEYPGMQYRHGKEAGAYVRSCESVSQTQTNALQALKALIRRTPLLPTALIADAFRREANSLAGMLGHETRSRGYSSSYRGSARAARVTCCLLTFSGFR